jgi:hypothetical protein
VAYVTDAPPDEMHWLNPGDAANVGIIYSLIKPPKPEPLPFIAPPTQPLTPTGSPAEQQATRLVQGYYAYWSQGGVNVNNLAQYYGDSVSFYGSMMPLAKVMEIKGKFSARWPIRHYTISPTSLFVQCAENACSVTGVVSWDVTSMERGAHSVGSANIALRITNGVIVSENGSVLTSHAETIEAQQASQTPSYAQGRQARIEYEQWITSLPNGSYRDGALFWAMQQR